MEHLEDEGLDRDALNRLGIEGVEEDSEEGVRELRYGGWRALDSHPVHVTANNIDINTITFTDSITVTQERVHEAMQRIHELEDLVNDLQTQINNERTFAWTERTILEERIYKLEQKMEKDDGQDVS